MSIKYQFLLSNRKQLTNYVEKKIYEKFTILKILFNYSHWYLKIKFHLVCTFV